MEGQGQAHFCSNKTFGRIIKDYKDNYKLT